MKEARFSRKLLLAVLPAVVVFVFLAGFSSYYVARRQVLQGVQKEVDDLAAHASAVLQAFFQQRLNDVESLAETPLLRDYAKNVDYGLMAEAEVYRREAQDHFRRFAARSGVYRRIAFVDSRGRTVCSVPDEAPAPKARPLLSPSAWALVARGGTKILPAARRSPGERLISRYAAPVFGQEGGFIGAVVVDLDLSAVLDVLRGLHVGRDGRALLEEADTGFVLGERPTFLNPLTGTADIPGTSWKVKVIGRADEFLAPLKAIKKLTAFFSGLVSLILFVLIARRVAVLVQPLQDMEEGTRRLAAGDLDYRLKPPAIRELKALALAFNDMAANLKEREASLQQHIRELSALREMDGAVIQGLDEEKILRVSLEAVSKGLALDRVGLYWVDEARREILGRYVFGTEGVLTEDSFRARRVPVGQADILNEVVRSRLPALVRDTAADPRLDPAYVQEARTREFAAAPICGKSRVFGVFVADNYRTGRPLTDSDKDALMLFANAVGLALENAVLLQNLTESEARLRAVLENSPAAVIGLSREHWITTWNKAAESIFGFDAAEMAGKPITALFAPGTEAETQRLLAELIEKGAVRDYPMPGRTKSGRPLELSLSWGGPHPDFWLNREWAVVIRDVTEAKRMQLQLIHSEKLAAVGQLISGVAHELNNPLQAVVGYAQILAEGEKYSAQDVRLIFDNAMRCRKIIDNLLLFVRQGEVKKRAVRLEDAVRHCLTLLDYKLKKSAAVRTVVDVPRNLPRVKADLQQLEQVFLNLVNNACDAMAGADGPKEVKVSARAAGGMVRVEVSDTGPGVPEDLRERVFEPFFTTKPAGRGTGLGLPLCRQIIEDHGGRLGLESRPGRGAVFFFELPTAAARESDEPRKERAAPRVRGKSVLVVDDEPAVLSLLKRVVEAEGERPAGAASFAEASALAAKEAFDLVVTDVLLGDGTGFSLYDAWQSLSPHPRPPFLFLTGDTLNAETERSLEDRGLPLLQKPVAMEELRKSMRQLLAAARRP